MKYFFFLLIAASLNAQVPLEGPWRMTRQDSPSFALPETSDSDNVWADVQLPWSAHPASGIFWIRKTVVLDAPLPGAVLVLGRVAASVEVFVNGQLAGTTPGFGSRNVEAYQPRSFRLAGGLPAGRVTIALRCWETKVWWSSPFADVGPYRLASPAMAEAALDHTWRQAADSIYPRLILSVAQVALGLYLLLVWRRDLRWIGLFLVSWGGGWCVYSYLSSHPSPMSVNWMVALMLLTSAGWNAFYIASLQVLDLPRRPWFYLVPVWAAIDCGLMLARNLDPGGNWIEHPNAAILLVYPLLLILSAMRLWQGLYRGPAALILLASIISLIANWGNSILGRGTVLQINWQGFSIPLTPLAYLLLSVWMSAEYLERLKRQRAERDRLAAEMDSARAVQASLLSTNTLDQAGYRAEAVYQPALEVGGDFYELIALPDGAMLVVAGDVSGKGLQAAMVVALALGALRNRHSSTPAGLLAEMNGSLVQRRSGGFVTCSVVRLDPDGRVTIASAGNPPPFVTGPHRKAVELAVPPGLPLGITLEAVFEEATEQLAPGEQLVLVSDGVVEAENANRELFGFDRTREISIKSALEIADVAKAWGQTDDITVVTVRRIEER